MRKRMIPLISLLVMALYGHVFAQDEPSTVQTPLRFINGFADSGAIDVLVEGEVLAELLPYGEASDWIIVNGPAVAVSMRLSEPAEGVDARLWDGTIENLDGEWRFVYGYGSRGSGFLGTQVIPIQSDGYSETDVELLAFNPLQDTTFEIRPVQEPWVSIPFNVPWRERVNNFDSDLIMIASDMPEETLLDVSELIETPFRSHLLTWFEGEAEPVVQVFTTDFGAQVTLQHFAFDAPALRLELDEQTILDNILYATPPADSLVLSGQYRARVMTDNDILWEDTLILEPTIEHVLTVRGSLADDSFDVAIERRLIADLSDNEAVMAGQNAFIRFYHHIQDAPPVDIVSQDGLIYAADISYGDPPALLDLLAGDYSLRVVQSDDPNVVFYDLSDITLVPGTGYSLSMIGTLEQITQGNQNLFIESTCVAPIVCD